jgi:DNA primase
MMKDRVVFPIHRRDGQLIAYTGRTVKEITDENPKWLLPPGLIKTKVLFNFHRVAGKYDSIIIVEGPLDLVAVHQAGLPNVVALLGREVLQENKHSYDQFRLIIKNFKQAIILLDGDEDGRESAAVCALKLCAKMFVRTVSPPEGKDPSDLTAQELSEILSFNQ